MARALPAHRSACDRIDAGRCGAEAGGGEGQMSARKQWDYPPSAYSLFLRGYDTIEIANRLRISEDVAVRLVNQERSQSKGLPFETRPSPYITSAVGDWLKVGNPHFGEMR